MRRSRPSLMRRAIAFFLLTIIVSAVVSGYLLNYYSEQFLKDISNRNTDLAYHVKEHVKLFLEHYVAELRELKLLIDEHGLGEGKVDQDELDNISAFHPLLEMVQVLDRKGLLIQVSPYNKEYIDLDMSGHKSFQGAIDLKGYDVYWSDSFISPHTNDPAVTISMPLNNGVLMALLNLKELSHITSSSLPEESEIIVITDRRGVAIAHPEEHMVSRGVNLLNLPSIRHAMEGRPGTYEEVWKKERGFSSVTAIEGSGWVVAVFQEKKIALGAMYHGRRVVVIAIILLLSLTMLAFLMLQRQGMKPIKRLEEKADMIAAGRYGEDLDAEFLELSGFVDSFNEMTRAVRSREEALMASEERFRVLFDEAAEPVFLMDSKGDLLAANKRACQSLGYSHLEFVQMNVSHFIVGQDREMVFKRLEMIGVGEAVTTEGEHQRKDGTVFPVEVRIARMEVDGQDRYIAHARDISLRKKAEEALMASEEKYRLLADNAIDVIWTMDMELRYLYFSPSINQFRGVSVEEAIFQTVEDAMTPDSVNLINGILQEELEKEKNPDSDPGRSRTFEARFKHKNGSLIWGEVTCAFLRDEDGKIIGMQGVTRDISERKQAEEELRQSEERFRTAFITSPDAICITRLSDGLYVVVNDGFCFLTGWDREKVIGETLREIDIWAADSEMEYLLEKLLKKGKVENLEISIRKKDGKPVNVLMSASLIQLEGEPHILSIIRDITDLKEAQSSQREAYRLMSTIIDSSPLGIVQTDSEGVIHLWNPAAERIFGWKAEEVMNKTDPTVPVERMDEFRSLYKKVLGGESFLGIETQKKRKDGTLVDVSISLARVLLETGEVEVMGIVEDITDKKAAENALRDSEERLRKISEGVFEGITISEKGIILEVNNQFASMFGYALEEIPGKKILDLVAPDYKDIVKEVLRSDSKEPYECEVLRKDGTRFTVEIRGTLTSYQGRPVRVAALRDVTDQRRAENVLREREKRYRLLYENNPLAYQSLSHDGTYLEVNSAWEALLGYDREEILGRKAMDLVDPDYRKVVEENFPKLIQNGEISIPDIKLTKKDGTSVHVTLLGKSSLDEDLGYVRIHCLLQDITERIRMEAALKKSAQLAAVGQVASGIAHEINNPLATISASTEALIARLPTLKKEAGKKKTTVDTLNLFQDYLTMIMDEVDRSSQIIRDLLDFTRMREYAFKRTDVAALISTTIRLLSIQSRMSKYAFEVDTPPDLPDVRGDRDRLRQVFIILLTNAVESMPEGGTIIINSSFNKSQKTIALSIKDSGTGISEDSLGQIFEPFYTTKDLGSGTGLGLSIADTIISKHEGRIEVKSNRGRGSTFTVILPLYEPTLEEIAEGTIH